MNKLQLEWELFRFAGVMGRRPCPSDNWHLSSESLFSCSFSAPCLVETESESVSNSFSALCWAESESVTRITVFIQLFRSLLGRKWKWKCHQNHFFSALCLAESESDSVISITSLYNCFCSLLVRKWKWKFYQNHIFKQPLCFLVPDSESENVIKFHTSSLLLAEQQKSAVSLFCIRVWH